jgi:hypothetical protein
MRFGQCFTLLSDAGLGRQVTGLHCVHQRLVIALGLVDVGHGEIGNCLFERHSPCPDIRRWQPHRAISHTNSMLLYQQCAPCAPTICIVFNLYECTVLGRSRGLEPYVGELGLIGTFRRDLHLAYRVDDDLACRLDVGAVGDAHPPFDQ